MKTPSSKSNVCRGRPPKCPPAGSYGNEKYILPETTRLTRSSRNQHRRNENLGGFPPQEVPTSTVSTDLPMQEIHLLVDHNGCYHLPQPPAGDTTIPYRRRMQRKRCRSPPRKCLSIQKTVRSTETNELGVDSGGSPSSQIPLFKLLQAVSSSEPHKRKVRQNTLQGAKACQAERSNLKCKCHSLQEAVVSLVRKENNGLRTGMVELLAENRRLNLDCQNLREEMEDNENFFQSDSRQKENEVRSLEKTVQLQNVKLQKSSFELESWMELEQGQAHQHEQLNALCGSYTDESATPILLHTALCTSKHAVTRFQKKFLKVAISENDAISWDMLNSNIFFARPRHLGYYAKSVIYDVLFRGFENESFNTFYGASTFLDPNLRQARFYEYYLREREQNYKSDIKDPQFEEFCNEKVFSIWKAFVKYDGESTVNISHFEALGGPQLALSIRAAAKSVWLLHKLAFSFEPPASIFRIHWGVDIDPDYMETVVNLEDNAYFLPKVGFMVAPGLRLRNTVMRCEVYLDGKNYLSDDRES